MRGLAETLGDRNSGREVDTETRGQVGGDGKKIASRLEEESIPRET